jgi:hypothetical protein
MKVCFDFRFRVRQFPFNPAYLTPFQPQSHGFSVLSVLPPKKRDGEENGESEGAC